MAVAKAGMPLELGLHISLVAQRRRHDQARRLDAAAGRPEARDLLHLLPAVSHFPRGSSECHVS